MDRLPYFQPPSSPRLWNETSNSTAVDVRWKTVISTSDQPHAVSSFYDGRFTCGSGAPPRQLQHCPSLPMCSHGSSQEDFHMLSPTDDWGWETSSSGGPFTTPSPISPTGSSSTIPRDELSWYPPLSPHSTGTEEPSPAGGLTRDSTQSNWTASFIDVHAPLMQSPPSISSPSVPLQSIMPFSLDGQDLLEDKVSDEDILGQEHGIYCCPLPTSNGVRCSALIPCEEAPLMAHLRGAHALRAKCVEKIPCQWAGCDSKPMQVASMPRHIMTRHVKKRVQCSYCSKDLTRKDGRAKHEKICRAKPRSDLTLNPTSG